MRRIAVIGGGLGGISSLRALVENAADKEISIDIYDSQDLCRGSAFAAENDSYLFNTLPSNTFGTSVEHPEEFYTWLTECFPGKEDTYVSRQIYRAYLEQSFKSTVGKAIKGGLPITSIKERVISVAAMEGGYKVGTKSGSESYYKVIMALGNITKQPYPLLKGHSKYVDISYSGRELDEISSDSHVLIIGSRLTAVDVLVALYDRGHSGKITVTCFCPISHGGLSISMMLKVI